MIENTRHSTMQNRRCAHRKLMEWRSSARLSKAILLSSGSRRSTKQQPQKLRWTLKSQTSIHPSPHNHLLRLTSGTLMICSATVAEMSKLLEQSLFWKVICLLIMFVWPRALMCWALQRRQTNLLLSLLHKLQWRQVVRATSRLRCPIGTRLTNLNSQCTTPKPKTSAAATAWKSPNQD